MTDAAPAQSMRVTPTSRLGFHEYVVKREPGRDPLVGCPRVRRFLEVDEDGLVALEALREAGSVDAAQRLLHERTGEEYELIEFAQVLLQKGFISEVDGTPVAIADDARERHPVLHAVKPHQVRWLRHPLTVLGVMGLTAFWITLMVVEPVLRPRFDDILLTRRPAANIALTLGGLFALAYVHELAHFFVARSYGIDATIKLSHRFYMIVLQTDVTNAWTLPPHARVAIFLAGIGFNLTVASLTGIALFLGVHDVLHVGPNGISLLRWLVYLNVFPLAFQLFIPARTDLYHLLLVVTGERNLLGDALLFVRFRFKRAWAALRGAKGRECGECPARVMPEDPFCLRCGARQRVSDPNQYPFRAESRRWLFGAGVFLFLGTLVGYAYFFAVASRFMLLHVGMASAQFVAAIAARSAWFIVEAGFALGLGLLQATFASYFVARGVYSMLLEAPLSWLQRVTMLPLLGVLPASWHSRVLKLVIRLFPRNVTWFELLPPDTPDAPAAPTASASRAPTSFTLANPTSRQDS